MSINIKKFLKVLPHAFTFILGAVFIVFFQEPIKHYIDRYYSKAELSYEVMSISKLSRHEIQKYEKAEKFESFNLNLDDSILNNYYIIKLRIKNEGIPINRDLKIQAAIDKTAAKFLDIKHKVHSPINKIIPIMYTIPDLTWSMKKTAIPFQKPALKWNAPKLNADGSRIVFNVERYNIYRSRLKEVGYGRINPILIKDTYYVDHSPELNNTAYYRVEAVKKAGAVSKLSDPISISFPEISAFEPYFENAVLIDPSKKVKVPNDSLGKPIYGSLTEAIEQEIDASVFIINKNKKEAKDVDKYTGNINGGLKIFYRDDLNFLSGKTDILLTSGLDADADIIFYFLVKIYPDVAFDFNLMLEGPPDVSFIKQTAQDRNNLFNKTENTSPQIDKIKASITPKIVRSYIGKKTIYVTWEITSHQPYSGVRIYRSEKNSIYDKNELGKELYDGKGKSNVLECESITPKETNDERGSIFPQKVRILDEPPRKVLVDPLAPPAPFNLKLEVGKIKIKASNDHFLYYFADDKVSSDKIYTYVLYAYDDDNNYSYPIVVNASLNDPLNDIICYTSDSITKAIKDE